jgi:hypothetical protein
MAATAKSESLQSMTSKPPLVRFCALVAPACMLVYGVLRWLDGLDGHHGPGVFWNVGHTFFFVAFVLLATLMVGIRPLVPRAHATAGVATVAAVAGAACFLWVTLGDLFSSFPALPDALQLIGPLLFEVGALTLLIQLVLARQVTAWSPVLVFLGFLAIAINLDLLPLGAVLVGVGLAPLARPALGPADSAAERTDARIG